MAWRTETAERCSRLVAALLCVFAVLLMGVPCAMAQPAAQPMQSAQAMGMDGMECASCCSHSAVTGSQMCCGWNTQPAEQAVAFDASLGLAMVGFPAPMPLTILPRRGALDFRSTGAPPLLHPILRI